MVEDLNSSGALFIVGTPIGNLKEITLRALETLKAADFIYCEDTRRSLKLLNAYEIKKPLRQCPGFKEKKVASEILDLIEGGRSVAYLTDAGMPAISDPGAHLVHAARARNLRIEVIGGTSSLTHFLAGLGVELPAFSFIGFLPPRVIDRQKLFVDKDVDLPTIFFESPHRLESTLKLLAEKRPKLRLALAKELSKISERYFDGTAEEILKQITSFKGEWIGLVYPNSWAFNMKEEKE